MEPLHLVRPMEVHENIEEKVVLIVNIIIMAKGYSYVVARDFGFAPNPFNGFLTLATCKPKSENGLKLVILL